jgi:hypothetical protein
MDIKPAHNSTYTQVGGQCFFETEVQGFGFVLRIKFSGGRQLSSPKSPTSCSCKPLGPIPRTHQNKIY